jgi:hypothetical protein
VQDYARLWRELHDACVAAGARSWVFIAEGGTGLYTEFIEWQGERVLEVPEVAAACDALNSTFFPGESGTWLEAGM